MRLRRGDDDLGPVERAVTVAARTRGLLGRTGIDGALVLSPASSVHTIGMRFAIDVAHLDADLRVLRITTMAPHRLGRPVRRSRHVLEAQAGSFARWGLRVGDVVAFVDDGAPAGPAPGDADSRRRAR
jgi:uncharacterized protein